MAKSRSRTRARRDRPSPGQPSATCPRCGAAIASDAVACPACGWRASGPSWVNAMTLSLALFVLVAFAAVMLGILR